MCRAVCAHHQFDGGVAVDLFFSVVVTVRFFLFLSLGPFSIQFSYFIYLNNIKLMNKIHENKRDVVNCSINIHFNIKKTYSHSPAVARFAQQSATSE